MAGGACKGGMGVQYGDMTRGTCLVLCRINKSRRSTSVHHVSGAPARVASHQGRSPTSRRSPPAVHPGVAVCPCAHGSCPFFLLRALRTALAHSAPSISLIFRHHNTLSQPAPRPQYLPRDPEPRHPYALHVRAARSAARCVHHLRYYRRTAHSPLPRLSSTSPTTPRPPHPHPHPVSFQAPLVSIPTLSLSFSKPPLIPLPHPPSRATRPSPPSPTPVSPDFQCMPRSSCSPAL